MLKSFSLITLLILGISCQKNTYTSHNQIINENKEPLNVLLEGNKRYISGHPKHPDQSLKKIKELNEGQNPFAVVISCSDSRVSPELIFDQGLGDLFVIRTAGNVIGDLELGSIEYAVEHLRVKLIIVMGHDKCGAVTAFCEHKHENNHIESIIKYLEDEEEEKRLDPKDPNYINLAIKANVLHGIHLLNTSHPILKEHLEKKELKITGALYHLIDGKVDLIEE